MEWALLGLVLVAAALYIYLPALRGEWLWDDNSEYTQNAELRDPVGWWHAWVQPSGPDYLPLKTDLQWLEWRAFGPNRTVGYHVVSVCLHVLSALLFAGVLLKLGLRHGWAGLAAWLWLAHPWNVESVAWAAELKNTLSLPILLAAFLAFLAYESSQSVATYWLSVGLFLAAMLCKSSVVMFPPALVLYRWWRAGVVTRDDWWDSGPFSAIAGGLGLVTIYFQGAGLGGNGDFIFPSFSARLLHGGWSLLYYTMNAILPVDLGPIHATWQVAANGWFGWVPLLIISSAAGLGWRGSWRKNRSAIFAGGIYILFTLPILGVIKMSFTRQSWVAEHFLYIPLLGFCALVAMGLRWLWRQRTGGPAWALAIASCATLYYLASARAYAATFATRVAYWSHALAINPAAPAAHYNLGLAMWEKGDVASARGQFDAAIRLRPQDARTAMALGEMTGRAGDLEGALRWFAEAEKSEPDLADVYYNRANLLAQAGRLGEAVKDYKMAARLAPKMADVHYNLGTALAQLGENSAAITEFSLTLGLAPDMGAAHFNLGNIYASHANLTEATPHFLAAAHYLPAGAEAQFAAADVLAATGRGGQAVAYFERALALDPHNNDIRQRYIEVLRTLGRSREALAQIELIGR